jgi:hypothetical protein
MTTSEPVESILRRAGREHHANSLSKRSGYDEVVDCISYSIVETEPEQQQIAEIAALIARECIGGVLIVTAENAESGGESIYLWGQPEDVKAVYVTIEVLVDFAESTEPTIFIDYEEFRYDFLGILKGILSELAYAHDSKNSIDSSTMAVIKEKEAFATQQLENAGVEPLLVNLTYFALDCLDEISMEKAKEYGRSI